MRRLAPSETLWQSAADNHHDITAQDLTNNFAADSTTEERFVNGTRPDYVLIWPGELCEPVFENAVSVTVQTSVEDPAESRDISDHYGFNAKQHQLRKYVIELNDEQLPTEIMIDLTGFHCLAKTPAMIELDTPFVDQPFLSLELNADGNVQLTKSIEIAQNGDHHTYETPPQISTADITALKVKVQAWDRNPLVKLEALDPQFAEMPMTEPASVELRLLPRWRLV